MRRCLLQMAQIFDLFLKRGKTLIETVTPALPCLFYSEIRDRKWCSSFLAVWRSHARRLRLRSEKQHRTVW